jgi:hypothetical protein
VLYTNSETWSAIADRASRASRTRSPPARLHCFHVQNVWFIVASGILIVVDQAKFCKFSLLHIDARKTKGQGRPSNSATDRSAFRAANFSTHPPCNGREQRYLIVACTVITDVPEAVGP